MKWLWRILGGLVALVLVAAAGSFLWLRAGLPEAEAAYEVNGVEAPVRIVRDDRGIPHIFAASGNDAFYALGFLHAQDRLWQMEATRRLGQGRLAETLPVGGDVLLRIDRTMRTFDIPGLARAAYADLSAEMRAQVDAYAHGVNAWAEDHRGALPPEFVLLGLDFEPWEPWQALIWPRLMALQLSEDYRAELARSAVLDALGPEAVADLWPDGVGRPPATLSSPADAAEAAPPPAAPPVELADMLGPGAAARLLAALPPPLGPSSASNAWVLAGDRTDTGAPILTNDPHLGLETPILWYLARIETPDLRLVGATVPGVPILLLGHNGHIAWGLTTTGSDVQDLVIERVDPGDPARYLTPDGSEPFLTREETIDVRFGEPVTVTVRRTRHGPVISDISPDAAAVAGAVPEGEHVLALAYAGFAEGDRTADAFYRLNRARSWDDFVDAMALWGAPQQNVVYADVEGNIGLFTPGRLPLRRGHDGAFPVPGWTGEVGWDGFVPPDELPQRLNPAEGRLVNANNAVVGPDYPHLIARSFDEAYRAERIVEMLDDDDGRTVSGHEAMLADTVSLAARDLLPLMLDGVRAENAETAEVLARLRRWDHRMDRNAAEPLVFVTWLSELHRSLYADELGPLYDELWNMRPSVVKRMLTDRPAWCDDVTTDATEDCADAIGRALAATLALLGDGDGGTPADLRWGDAHVAPLEHQLFGRVPLVRDLLSNAVETDGGHFTVNRGGFYGAGGERPFAHTHGAGFRAVYDLSDLENSRFVIATGQSGHPLSRHWGDMVETWASGGHFRIAGDPAALAADGAGTLTLRPER